MDYNKMAAALIKALNTSTQSQLNLLDTNRRNFGEDTMNAANARGTLYSSGNTAQKTRYDATEYLPKYTQTQANQQQQELSINNSVMQTKQKIDAMNEAAKNLNSIGDNYFGKLLEYAK